MKKKMIIVIVCISILLLILLLVLFNTNDKKEKDIFKSYSIDNYSFDVLEKYNFKIDNDKNIGYLDNEMFVKSYIYLSSKKYKDLISLSAYYEDMGGKEVDSDIDEIKLGKYDAFINVKEIEYKDVDEHNNLVIILIKIEEDKTFVFQYETKIKEDKNTILQNVKQGLKNIEKEK